MDRAFILTAGPVRLRAIGPDDLEDLRLWKNAHREAFFFKGVLSSEDQRRWFEGYRKRANDYMFVVEDGGAKAGCMGFRLEGGEADAYNIIGAPEARGKGVLGAAMKLLCSYILKEHRVPVSCKVVKGNPAVGWYEKCGYKIVGKEKDHVVMRLDEKAFAPVAYERAP